MKSPEMNSPVPSMKKQRSASPSQAMPMSAFSAITRSTMSRRFSSISGLASWFGKAAVDVEAQARGPAGQPVEQLRRDQAAHAAAGVEHDVERLDRPTESMNDMHVLDVGGRARSSSSRCRGAPPAAGTASSAIMSRMSAMPSSPLSGNASLRTIFMPLYCFGLCDAVICDAAVVAVAWRRRSTACRSRSCRSRRRRRPARWRRR